MTIEPKWLTVARALRGVREVPGAGNSPTIMGWAAGKAKAFLGALYNADSVPWCGLLAAHCIAEAGLKPPAIALRAKSWATWGVGLSREALAPGAVLVFEREGGGHVAFYVGEDDTAYHVLGGNQSDQVNIMRIAKARCIARRWPASVPLVGRPVRMDPKSAGLSRNEA